MDLDMIRPRRCKPCPPPPPPPAPPPAPPSHKKEEPPPPPPSSPHGEHVMEACQHECCNIRGYPFPSPLPPSMWPCHPPPQSYWNDDVDRFSRMHRMNFRDPMVDYHEDHSRRRCIALQPPSVRYHRRGPPPMLTGHHHGQPSPPLLGHHHEQPPLLGHHGQPPLLMGHRREQPPLLLGHHHEPPPSYFPPPCDYGYQHGYYHEIPNGCRTM
ncbi:leucine-rich repeat extensin-like protein 5 [Capsicum chacoense]